LKEFPGCKLDNIKRPLELFPRYASARYMARAGRGKSALLNHTRDLHQSCVRTRLQSEPANGLGQGQAAQRSNRSIKEARDASEYFASTDWARKTGLSVGGKLNTRLGFKPQRVLGDLFSNPAILRGSDPLASAGRRSQHS